MHWSLFLIITLAVLFAIVSVVFHKVYQKLKLAKSDGEIQINKNALPLVKDDSRYIELQTKEWIKKRNSGEPCYAVLEKDKIVMTKWMKMFNVNTPKIHYYGYHDQFTLNDLKKVVSDPSVKDKKLVIKISHLQSSYGIIIIPPNPSDLTLEQIYMECKEKFKTSFVCNHDRNDPPTEKEIKRGEKETYYKLYETIKPGIIIQDFFYSKPTTGDHTPTEFKILLVGDRIIYFGKSAWVLYNFITSPERFELLFEEARKIRSLLGATFIRVDFFVKDTDNPYVPYLNEISLSPNGGMGRATFHSSEDIAKYKKEITKASFGDYKELNKLIIECPFRDLPIKRYLTDAESQAEKYHPPLL